MSKVLCLPRKMKMDRSKVLCLSRKMQVVFRKPCKSIAHVTQNDFRLFFRHMRMSWSATPATQNEIRTACETFANERCCSLPHIDTATAGENQRIETRHVGASKRAFLARCPPAFRLCSFKIGVFRRVFSWTWNFSTSKSLFRASIFTTCHKMPPCHGICTLSPLDAALPMRFARNTQHDTPEVLRLPHKMTMEVSKVLRLPWKRQAIFWKRCENTRQLHRTTFDTLWNMLAGMAQSATRATRNEVMRRLKPPKVTTFAALPHLGTAIATSSRTVANGCTRLWRQKQRRANMTQPSEPQSKTRTLPHSFGKNQLII